MDESADGLEPRALAPTISDEPKKKKPGLPGFLLVW